MRIKKLPDTEFEVMQAIWACEVPVSRADIDVILQEKHPMALTTLPSNAGKPQPPSRAVASVTVKSIRRSGLSEP